MKKEEKITEAMRDIKFVEKIIDIRSPEEMQKAFATKEIDLSLEDAQAVISTIKKLSESKSGEVSDEDLEEISGGATSSTNSIIPFVVIGGLMTAIVVGDSVNKVYKICEMAKEYNKKGSDNQYYKGYRDGRSRGFCDGYNYAYGKHR